MPIQSVNPFADKWIWASKWPNASLNPITLAPEVWQNLVAWFLWTTSAYAMDIINPAWDGTKSALNVFNPNAYKDNWVFKNIPKSLLGAVTRYGTALKNIPLGIVPAIGKGYQNVIQDNAIDIASATVDKIPYVWAPAGNLVKWVVTAPAFVWKVPNVGVKWLDRPFNWANTKTARKGKSIPTPELRAANDNYWSGTIAA